jgi:hypothetical protein
LRGGFFCGERGAQRNNARRAVGEQKGIGENLGKLLFVRKTINVNSTPIRAFQMVLEQRGLGWKKVMILVRRAPPGETERQAEKKEGES